MEKDWLDFLIIGAQKAGTTSLYRYMRGHPRIHMPLEKEAAFFAPDGCYTKGWQRFVAEHFRGASQGKLWGKASPQYMGYPGVAASIAETLPRVRLIALLRDPVTRAHSHYRMSVRRGWERRTFEEAVIAQLDAGALRASRRNPTETNSYVIWGEYGRVLLEYRKRFPPEQLLVMFTEDLEREPRAVMDRIWAYLQLESYVPPNLGERYHVGGIREKLPWIRPIMALAPVRILWHLVPGGIRRPARYWFEQWNVTQDSGDSSPMSPALTKALRDHFTADSVLLHNLGVAPPWEDGSSQVWGTGAQ